MPAETKPIFHKNEFVKIVPGLYRQIKVTENVITRNKRKCTGLEVLFSNLIIQNTISLASTNDCAPQCMIILSNLKKPETQPAFTCSKLTIETLEQGVKYVQS